MITALFTSSKLGVMGPMSYHRLLGGDGQANIIFIAITQQPHSIINFINKHESIAAL